MKRALSLLFVLFSFSSVCAGSEDTTLSPSIRTFLFQLTDFDTKNLGSVVSSEMVLKLKNNVSITNWVDAFDVYDKAQVKKGSVPLLQFFSDYYKDSSLQNNILICGGCLLVSMSLTSSVVNLCGAIKKRFKKNK